MKYQKEFKEKFEANHIELAKSYEEAVLAIESAVKVFLICSGSLGKTLVSNVHGMKSVKVISIFTSKEGLIKHQEWS